MSDLRIINQIGLFSKKNLALINYLKKNNIPFKVEKRTTKNTITTKTCTAVFDYNDLQVKTKGDCDELIEFM